LLGFGRGIPATRPASTWVEYAGISCAFEARVMSAGEPKVIEVQFVSVEKVVTASLLIEIGAPVPEVAPPAIGVLCARHASGPSQ